MIIRFVTILGHRFETDFAQACDLFEKFKVVGQLEFITLTYKDEVQVDFDRGRSALNQLVEVLKKDLGTFPIFVHLHQIVGNDIMLLNSRLSVPYYRDEEVKMISDGRRFYMLDEFISDILSKPTWVP